LIPDPDPGIFVENPDTDTEPGFDDKKNLKAAGEK
jgi:hypothetical protein